MIKPKFKGIWPKSMKQRTKGYIQGILCLLSIIVIIVLLFVNPLLIAIPVGIVFIGFFSFGIGLF